MLWKRLIAGSIMASVLGMVLYLDGFLSPIYPGFLLIFLVAGYLASRELVSLFPSENRPALWLSRLLVLGMVAMPFVQAIPGIPAEYGPLAWLPVGVGVALFFILTLLIEMRRYEQPGGIINRIAHSCFLLLYLGLLPTFLLKIRWLTPASMISTNWLLALAIFIPKVGDIGAYFVGRYFGQHPMTPNLSPKKTWEGLAGGLATSVLVTLAVHEPLQLFPGGTIEAILFGIIIGGIGVLGDLAESLIKRDGYCKDASQSIPGFGGVLDVIDSVLFASPFAYFWFHSRL